MGNGTESQKTIVVERQLGVVGRNSRQIKWTGGLELFKKDRRESWWIDRGGHWKGRQAGVDDKRISGGEEGWS